MVAAAAFALIASRAIASGIPTTETLTYSGRLEDASGAPLTGSKNVQLYFWQARTGGTTPLCLTPSSSVALEGGRFSLKLPDTCAAVVKSRPDVWVEVVVDGTALPRTKLGAVPYAVEANHATSADTASAAAGSLKTTVDGLSARATRVVRVEDTRDGCPPAAAAGADLLRMTFTLSKPTPVSITGDMIRNHSGRADIALVVDGTQRFIGIGYSPELTWAPAHVEWSGVLAAGSHTAVILNGQVGGGGVADVWGCRNLHGAMTALIFE
jgi:hypothetical protein